MDDIVILDREAFNIRLNKSKCIFNVNLIADVEYNEEGFQEFLEYFKSGWIYIKENSLTYYMFINLGICKKEHELPIHAYIKLIKMIMNWRQRICTLHMRFN